MGPAILESDIKIFKSGDEDMMRGRRRAQSPKAENDLDMLQELVNLYLFINGKSCQRLRRIFDCCAYKTSESKFLVSV